MSTPANGGDQPWHQPGQEHGDPPVQQGQPGQQSPPEQQAEPWTGSGYGQPSSPSYGKYGQGQALPTAPVQTPPTGQFPPPGQQPWGQQPGPGGPAWGQAGYAPPGRPQQWVTGPTTLQPASSLTNAVIVLSVLTGIALCLVASLAPNQNQILRDAINGVQASTAVQGSAGYRVASAFGILAEVAVWVVTALWLTRIRQNAVVLQPGGQRRSETWVWLGWVIPIVNFWFPKQLIDDALRATAWATGTKPPRTGFWWAAWIMMAVLGGVQAAATLLPPDDSLHLTVTLVDAIVTVVALVLWIRIVRRLSVDQDALLATRPVATLQG
jgi:Domain of unknown function (DUF4328)